MGQAYPGTVAAPNFVMTLEKDTVMTLNNCTSEPTVKAYLSKLAHELAYSETEIRAGLEYADRASRRSHPLGEWDNAGRFYALERTLSVTTCRSPSKAWPYSQMVAARTAAHCAEVYKADNATHVGRIGRAYNKLLAGEDKDAMRRLLTKGIRKREAELARAPRR